MAYKRFTKETTSWIMKVAGTNMTQKSRFPSILGISEDEFKKHWEFRVGDGISLLPPLKASEGLKEVQFELLENKNRQYSKETSWIMAVYSIT